MNSNPMHSTQPHATQPHTTPSHSSPMSTPFGTKDGARPTDSSRPTLGAGSTSYAPTPATPINRLSSMDTQVSAPVQSTAAPAKDNSSKLADDLQKFQVVAQGIRSNFKPAADFDARCVQAFDLANDLFGNAPTWVCFYRELMGGEGLIPQLFPSNEDFGRFLRCDQYYQIQMMLTALRSRDLPENDPNDPQRMITVRLPKSLHEALCDEAIRLGISVNRLCISRMLQLLDPKMIPETGTKPRGRKPRTRNSATTSTAAVPALAAQTSVASGSNFS